MSFKSGMNPCVSCDMISFRMWLVSVVFTGGLGAFVGTVVTLRW